MLLLDVLANAEVFVLLLLEADEAGLLVARNDQGQIEITERVQEEDLLLGVVLEVEVVELRVLELPVLLAALVDALRVGLPQDVLEEERDRGGNQVLEDEWRGYREVAHGDELSLLGVEVHVAANAVDVRVQDHEDPVVVALHVGVLPEHFGLQQHGLLLEDLRLLLQERNLGLRRPLEFLVTPVEGARRLLLVLEVVNRPHLHLVEPASP